ncbi:MAG TPA: hypothetical protein VJW96_10705 [Terriglobales bacterium]|jgi:hypothetical protein|nr:hypothetical protein [Terriglobales bacterium]
MALARIITRSQTCSRELALDLLARGYAVEIVSPDRVPDSIADLELRVDTGPGDRLIANVEAHDGQRSASLEFVHHLRAPMGDFMRRPPAPLEAVHSREQPVRSSAKPGIEVVELPADAPRSAVMKVSPTAEIPLPRELDSRPEQGARPIVPQVPSPPPAVKPPGYFAVEDMAMAQATMVSPVPVIVPPRKATDHRDRSAGWRWRATLTFAGMVLLGVVLAFGIRRAGKDARQNSGTLKVDKIAASAGVNPLDVNPLAVNPLDENPLAVNRSIVTDSRTDPRGPGNVSGSALPPAAVNSAVSSGHAPEEAQIAKVARPAASPRAGASRNDGNDLIARDTVIYLDKRFEPAPKAKQPTALARRHPKPRPHSGGVIAANSVTYLNKPAPNAGK